MYIGWQFLSPPEHLRKNLRSEAYRKDPRKDLRTNFAKTLGPKPTPEYRSLNSESGLWFMEYGCRKPKSRFWRSDE